MLLFSNFSRSTSSGVIPTVIYFNFSFSSFSIHSFSFISFSGPPDFLRFRISRRWETSRMSLATSLSLVALTLFLRTFCMICFARSANLRVLIVSSTHDYTGATVAIKQVFVFPPKESYRSRVSFESRYGWKTFSFYVRAKLLIIFPSVVRDRFIVFSSLRCA